MAAEAKQVKVLKIEFVNNVGVIKRAESPDNDMMGEQAIEAVRNEQGCYYGVITYLDGTKQVFNNDIDTLFDCQK